MLTLYVVASTATARAASFASFARRASAFLRMYYGRFPKFHRVFLGRDPGTLKSDIVSKKTSTISLFGFETLNLKIRRLTLWMYYILAIIHPPLK